MIDERWAKIVGSVDVTGDGTCPTVVILRNGVPVTINLSDLLPDDEVAK